MWWREEIQGWKASRGADSSLQPSAGYCVRLDSSGHVTFSPRHLRECRAELDRLSSSPYEEYFPVYIRFELRTVIVRYSI
jgi:hypothetical protein